MVCVVFKVKKYALTLLLISLEQFIGCWNKEEVAVFLEGKGGVSKVNVNSILIKAVEDMTAWLVHEEGYKRCVHSVTHLVEADLCT